MTFSESSSSILFRKLIPVCFAVICVNNGTAGFIAVEDCCCANSVPFTRQQAHTIHFFHCKQYIPLILDDLIQDLSFHRPADTAEIPSLTSSFRPMLSYLPARKRFSAGYWDWRDCPPYYHRCIPNG